MSRARLLLPYVLVVAFAIRVVAAVGVERVIAGEPDRRFLIAGDAEGYWDLASRLTRGETYAIHDPPRYTLRMPGFPVVLAAGLLVSGGSRFGVRVWLALVGTLACGLVYVLGRELFDEPTAIVATALTAIAPTLVGFSVLVLSETTFAAAMLGSLLAFAVMLRPTDGDDSRYRSAFVVGLVTAVAVYARPAWLLAAPVFAVLDLVLSRDRRQALVRGGLIGLGLVLALSPWIVRNAYVTGHFVPTTLWLGPTLYDGLHPGADGGSEMQFFEDDRAAGVTRGMSEYEIDRHYRNRAWAFVVAQPGRAVWLAWEKQRRFWSPWPNAAQFRHPAGILAVLVFHVPLILFAAVGAWSMREAPRRFWPTVGPLLYFAALHLVFVGSLRYRLPAEYPLWIAAAVGGLRILPACRTWLAESRSSSLQAGAPA